MKKRFRLQTTAAALGCVLSLAGAWLAPAASAQAGTNTVAIFANTLRAYPSCMQFKVEGMCFFLRCSLRGCSIRSSIKVTHYVPDAIISTYNDPALHPWDDIGKLVAVPSSGLGSFMLGALTDSSSGSHDDSQRFAVYKGADAYGNPVGMIGMLLTGQLSSMLVTFDVPGTSNLMGFVSEELPRIPSAWASVPKEMLETVMGQAYEMVRKPLEIADKIRKIPSLINNGKRALNLMNGLTPAKVLSLVGIDIGPLLEVYQMIQTLTSGGPFVSVGPQTFCPGSASMLSLHFQSELDGHFWRGTLPVESLYPASWLPLQNTSVGSWGGLYPRTGHVVQQDPVRASGVIAERVASIIRSENQPHVYTPLKTGSGYRYFSNNQQPRWQRLYPDAQGSCHTFGSATKNYSSSERSITDGYVWNLWQSYTCCQSRGRYLFSIP